MTPAAIRQLAARYARLHIAVVGDFCLDRYLDIDPSLDEVSIETGRTVHNVVRVRAEPGAAGTIVNNLVALGIGRISPIGLVGDDGEGYELLRALSAMPGVSCEGILRSKQWRTFTYCKPMLHVSNAPPVELDRLDTKNWAPMPAASEERLVAKIRESAADAYVVMDQVDREGTGVVTRAVRDEVADKRVPVLADSRRGLAGFPPMIFKMNAVELTRLANSDGDTERRAIELAGQTGRLVVITLSERGILAAEPNGQIHRASALPVRGPIDIVGAGDCVTANLIAAFASAVAISDALTLAMTAASLVIHQLGTTGTATLDEIAETLAGCAESSVT